MAIQRSTERVMVRAMCGVKLVDKRKKTKDLMEKLGLKESLDQLAKTDGMPWYGHVMRDGDYVLRRALDFKSMD